MATQPASADGQLLILQLETNAGLWELQANRAANPHKCMILNRRARRSRELADRLRKEIRHQRPGPRSGNKDPLLR